VEDTIDREPENHDGNAGAQRLGATQERRTLPLVFRDAADRPHYLHGRWIEHPSGTRQLLAYFAHTVRPIEALDTIPDGYEIVVSRANGRPYVRRVRT
jgi:hypothetical protein